eukprot:SAG31_NODE_83_length_27039_cov_14.035746_28_plen_79_part_00
MKINDPQFAGWFLHEEGNVSAYYHVRAVLFGVIGRDLSQITNLLSALHLCFLNVRIMSRPNQATVVASSAASESCMRL